MISCCLYNVITFYSSVQLCYNQVKAKPGLLLQYDGGIQGESLKRGLAAHALHSCLITANHSIALQPLLQSKGGKQVSSRGLAVWAASSGIATKTTHQGCLQYHVYRQHPLNVQTAPNEYYTGSWLEIHVLYMSG